MNIDEFLSKDLQAIKIDRRHLTVEAVVRSANRQSDYSVDLGGHPLSNRMCEFLLVRGHLFPAGTIVNYCHAFTRLLECFRQSSYRALNAESFSHFLNWMRTAKSPRTQLGFGEGTRRAYANCVLKFMEWLADENETAPHDLLFARMRHQKAFKGAGARDVEQIRLTAVSPEEFVRLLKAIRLEYEECRSLLERSLAEQKAYENTFPLLPFSMLLGLELAVRTVEFNYINVRDLRGERLLLNPPNKRPSEVRLSPGLMATLDLAQKWMSRYRANPHPDEPLLVCQLRHGCRSVSPVRFDTVIFNVSLRKFYQKYFNVIDADGMPGVYGTAEGKESTVVAFKLPFRSYRSAAITEAARHEQNVSTVVRFARHKTFATTMKHYIRETHRRWLANVTLSLAPSAELLRIALQSKLASSEEEALAQRSSALVPGGHCDQFLSGDHSCRRLRIVGCAHFLEFTLARGNSSLETVRMRWQKRNVLTLNKVLLVRRKTCGNLPRSTKRSSVALMNK